MGFYTADWVRKLVKEDHAALMQHINKKGNDFRSYIDSTLPFSLYLDIDNIRANVLQPNSKFIEGLSVALGAVDTALVIRELDKAYQKTINYYIDTYDSLSSEELSAKLQELQSSIEQGNIKSTLQSVFKNTFTISNISKKNKSVLIVSPKFTTIQSKFGSVVKENFDLSSFSDLIDDTLDDSPRNVMKKYLDKNFSVLNNLGHMEIDVLSSAAGSTEVKRGLVSPRLLQALIEWPKDSKPELLARRFSKETGQADTRIIVRKKFSNSKLVLEMLIEAGIMIGGVESQEENLRKAPKERAFIVGQNLTAKIKADPSIIANLETSKSIAGYLSELITSTISGKPQAAYTSHTEIRVKTPISRLKVEVKPNAKQANSVRLPTGKSIKPNVTNLVRLQNFINSHLQDVISANMGDGTSTKILNYRTGRLAASAKVEKLTKSKEGMITAFYSYMRNPYGTFEPGGAQGSPLSRDPKLLIAKSIREIAAEKVANRLRAVVV